MSVYSAEYFARYNLGNDVPFEPYTNGIVSYTNISSASRGAIRPNWELLYAHYVQIKGLDAPWTTAYLNNTLEYFGGFEGGTGSMGEGSGHYDGLGWGSLLYHLDESDLASTFSTAMLPTSTSSTVEAAETVKSIAGTILTTKSQATLVPTSTEFGSLSSSAPFSTASASLASNTPTSTSIQSIDSAQSTPGSRPKGQGSANHGKKGKGCSLHKMRK